MVSADVRWPELDDADAKLAPHIDVGHPTHDHSTPDALCLLTLDGKPTLCVRLCRTSNESYTFRDAQYWRGLLIVGWGDAFYVIDPQSNSVIRHDLGTYFGYIHAGDALLIASAESVVRVHPDGAIAWTSEPVGLDGVTFSNVDAEFIDGDGEWDPPGGWNSFRLRLTDGSIVSIGESTGSSGGT